MRLKPEDRKAQILNAALHVVNKPGGWNSLTRTLVAQEAGCTDGLVSKYFGTMLTFRRTIMRAAISTRNLSVIAQGIAAGDKYAQKAPDELKAAALGSL